MTSLDCDKFWSQIFQLENQLILFEGMLVLSVLGCT
jgi:hypothetical protein